MTTDPFAGLPPDPAAKPPALRTSDGGAVVIDPKATPYTLKWPVEYDGTEYREVCINRVTAGDRARFDRPRGPRAARNVVQLVRTPDGKRLPPEVFDGMDAEDGFAIIDMVEPMIAPHFPPAPKAPTFAGDAHRRMLFLDAPVDFDGKLFDRIEVRRLTAREISTFLATPVEGRGLMPSFYDDAGKPVPDAVIEALSFEDTEAVGEAMNSFMPAALKADRAAVSTSAPETGETSPQS